MQATSESGQTFIMDFMFGFLVFVLAWGYIVSQFNTSLAQSSGTSDIQSMRLMADYTLEQLVKTSGSPNNWEALTVNDLNYVGLATSDRHISPDKLEAFSNFSSSYTTLKSKMNIYAYDFYFDFSGSDHVTAGLPPQGNANEVIAQRIVDYKGGVATATLTLYKLQQ